MNLQIQTKAKHVPLESDIYVTIFVCEHLSLNSKTKQQVKYINDTNNKMKQIQKSNININ